MDVRSLAIEGAWEFSPRQFADSRGVFLEWFKDTSLSEVTGQALAVAQANLSVSAAGVVRGIHFADVPPGQAKYVTCVRGAVLDVVVDIRVGSPTFGTWESCLLDDVDRRALFISEGLGHVFMSLEDDSMVSYLCSTAYAPTREHEVHPLDPALGIDWPTSSRNGSPITPSLSEKDAAAPTLAEAHDLGLLPTHESVAAWRSSR